MADALLIKISIPPKVETASSTDFKTLLSSRMSTIHGRHLPPASSTKINKTKTKLTDYSVFFGKQHRNDQLRGLNPVLTGRCFNVYTSSITMVQRHMNVKLTLCAYSIGSSCFNTFYHKFNRNVF